MSANWHDAWQSGVNSGLLSLSLPADLGGRGLSVSEAVTKFQSYGEKVDDLGLALGLSAQAWPMQMPILEFGTTAQHAQLAELGAGRLTCCHAITEAQSGSDALALATHAEKVDGGYRLSGEKALIGMAPVADLGLVFATLNPSLGAWGVTAFLVDLTTDGVTRLPATRKMGSNALPFGGLRFENAFIPDTARLGREGAGAAIFARSLDWERRCIFAGFVGAMKRQLRETIAFAKERSIFGHAIEGHQSVSNRLAEMRLRFETAKLMLEKAAREVDEDARDDVTAAMTKLHISEAFLANSEDSMRIFAGQGYMEGARQERDLREAMGAVIYGGTSDIQRNIIAAQQSRKGL